jgi:hypothetical protein
MPTILTDDGEHSVKATDSLWLSPADAEHVTGWTWKPEGMCRGEICVPLPATMTHDNRVDTAAFWAHLGNPVLHDDVRETWVLGTGAETRNAALAGLDAPDFALRDLDGIQRRLSELRGSKVFLTTWASW